MSSALKNFHKIESLNVSNKWKQKFHTIDEAGELRFTYENFRGLSRSERLKIGLNLWGFLFGPFYYFAKGIWIKGLVLLLIGFPLAATGVGVMLVLVIAGAFANYDYYRLKVHNDKIWFFNG